MDSSIFLSHFNVECTGTCNEESRSYPENCQRRPDRARTDAGVVGLRLFLLGDCHRGFDPFWRGLSPWTRSAAKRFFDCLCVLLSLPVVAPLLLVVGAAVRFTSRGPVLFLQERMGLNGRTFTIFKFRTMTHVADKAHQPIATLHGRHFTPVGPFLRRWKLDELPQLANVLLGHLSLIGPRPKMPEHVMFALPCRPGITGPATIAFAQEASILAGIPREKLDEYYRDVVLPAKRQMDAEYLAQATLFSDLGLLLQTALRHWNPTGARTYIAAAEFELLSRSLPARAIDPAATVMRMPLPARSGRMAAAEQATVA